jgi:TolA-binding protein
LIGIIAVYQQSQSNKRDIEAADRLSHANDLVSLQTIAKEYSDKAIGAQALLRLGDLQFEAGHFPEAAGVYQELIGRFPSNPLADSARMSAVAAIEAQGKFEEAKTQYLQLASRQNNYLAVAAKVAAAR